MVTEFKDSPGSTDISKPESGAQSSVPASQSRAALVKHWLKEIEADEKFWKETFDQMRKDEQIATEGADADWVKGGKYVAPIAVRMINQSVAQLYAKNPKAIASRRRKLLYTLWDENPESLQAAMVKVTPPETVMTSPDPALPPIDTATGAEWEPDPQSVALLEEVAQAQEYKRMVDNVGKGLELLWDYFTGEQSGGFKLLMKAAVRRTKVCKVSYVKLGFQRLMQPNPGLDGRIDDATSKLKAVEACLHALQGEEYDAQSAEAEQLRTLLADLEREPKELVYREGPIFEFPEADEIIPHRRVKHLKTFTGCDYITHRLGDMTPSRVFELYGVDLKAGSFTDFREKDTKDQGEPLARVYEVQDKKRGQILTVCAGYDDFLKEPATPDVKIERFWTVFPLIFNETQSREKKYPHSDIYLTRHATDEYNRAREGLREHRKSSRPKYATARGALADDDMRKLESGEAFAILSLKALKPGTDVKSILQAIPAAPIDPNFYDTNPLFQDFQRISGFQEANLGGTSGSSATESTIAENSRGDSRDENIDDLDEMLSALAHAFAQLCLAQLSKETVLEIVGPGAVWPDLPPTREEIAKDLQLSIKAGSSGRPNAAVELAKIERALPSALQLPGKMHWAVALVERQLRLLDIDPDELEADAIPPITPSVVAQNALDGRGGPPAAQPNDPNAQGEKGALNAPNPRDKEPVPQPAMPSGEGPTDGRPMKQA